MHLVRFCIICLLLLTKLHLAAQSNEGTEFWFGFMEHADKLMNTKVVMISSKHNTSGSIDIPGLASFNSRAFTVTANQAITINLPIETEFIGSELIKDIGIQVTSELPVSVYIHQYFGARSEATVVLPVESLGKDYYTLSYRGVDFGNGIRRDPIQPSEFLIVGVIDETEVEIELSDHTQGGRNPGDIISVKLNEGDVYQVRGKVGADDLSATHISANKSIAVFAGASWTTVPQPCGAQDNLLEQMYPIESLGNTYITIPNEGVQFDQFRLLAVEDDTEIQVDNGAGIKSYNLNTAEIAEYSESRASFITGNKPYMVMQYNVGSRCSGRGDDLGDPSMVLLNAVEQLRDTVTLFNSQFAEIELNYINIITRTIDEETLIFDGQSALDLGIQFERFKDFSYARLQVNPGSHTIISGGCGVVATAYGYGNLESYAYSGGSNFVKINANPIPDGGCVGLPITFSSGLPPGKFDVEWDLGGGVIMTEHQFDFNYPEVVGDYPVKLKIYDRCFDKESELNKDIKVTFRKQVEADIDSILICEGESFSLGAFDVENANYEWSGPRDYFEELQFPTKENALPEHSGNYEVIGIVFGCATFPDNIAVKVEPTPHPFIGLDSVICTRDDNTHILDAGSYVEYLWQDGSNEKNFEVTEPGTYHVAIMDEFGCVGTDSISLEGQCPTLLYIPNVFTPNSIGDNNSFGIHVFSPNDIIEMDFRIYDRWGNYIFQSFQADDRWDGKINGTNAQSGTYTWVVDYTGYKDDVQLFKESLAGTVLLIE